MKQKTRRERLESVLYLRLKKRNVFKCVLRGPFGLFENPVCCKISKKLKGALGRQKTSKKSRTMPKKASSGFVSLRLK